MTARNQMTYRATVQRDAAAGTDDWGQAVQPDYQPHGTFDCRVWSRQRRELVGDDRTAVVEDLRAMFPLGSDLQNRDRITALADRRGDTVLPGAFLIGPLQLKGDHIEAALERVT